MIKDMTSGNPLKLILFFSIPLLIGNVFQQMYNMVDTIIVGRFLGVKALAAVGSTGSIIFLIFGLILGFTSGLSVLISRYFGANDTDSMKKAIASSIYLCIYISIFVTIFGIILTKPLLNIMNTPKDIYKDALSYLMVMFLGTFALCFYNMISGVLRAVGDSKTPLYFLTIACFLNIILDLVFIVNFSMGVNGAAYATVISQTISGILCLIYINKKIPLLKLNKDDFKFDKSYYSRHLKIAIPMAFQHSIVGLGIVIIQGAANKFGSDVVGAYTAASKVEQLVMQPSITFGVAIATYCAQNLGANNISRIHEGVKKCAYINIFIGLLAGFILSNFGEFFVSLFVSNPSQVVIEHSVQYLTTVAYFFIPLSLIFVYRNALQGMGHSFTPTIVCVFELVARAIVTYSLIPVLGYTALCLGNPAAWLAAFIPLFIVYYKKIKLLLSDKEISC